MPVGEDLLDFLRLAQRVVAVMDSPTIRQLRREWQALGTAPASRAACHRLAGRAPAVDRLGVDDLAELVAALSPSSARLTRNEAAAVIAAMLRSADVDELISGGLALAQRFDISEGPWSDLDAFFSDAISCLWEQITM